MWYVLSITRTETLLTKHMLSNTCTQQKNALLFYLHKTKKYWDCNGNTCTYLVSALSIMSTKNDIFLRQGGQGRNKIKIKLLSNNLRGKNIKLQTFSLLTKTIAYENISKCPSLQLTMSTTCQRAMDKTCCLRLLNTLTFSTVFLNVLVIINHPFSKTNCVMKTHTEYTYQTWTYSHCHT